MEAEVTQRIGKDFDIGAPYLSGAGIYYSWPGKNFEDFRRRFKEDKERLGEAMLERAKILIKEHNVRTSLREPTLQHGEKREVIHIDTGGRWITIGPEIGGGICSYHNLDFWQDHIMGFNLAADALEYLDKTALAPRINIKEGRYVVQYPLPNGLSLLPIKSLPSQKWFERKDIVGLVGRLKEISLERTTQVITLENGVITASDGMLKGEGFQEFHAKKATYVLAKMIDSCSIYDRSEKLK